MWTLVLVAGLVAATAWAGPCTPGPEGRVGLPATGFRQVRIMVQWTNQSSGQVGTIGDSHDFFYDDTQMVYRDSYIRSQYDSFFPLPHVTHARVADVYAKGVSTQRIAHTYCVLKNIDCI